MLIHNLFNHKHKLANTPLLIRGVYSLPALVLLFISDSYIFQLTLTLFYLVLILFVTKIHIQKLFLLLRVPAVFIILSCLTLIITIKSPNPFLSFKGITLGVEQENLDTGLGILIKSLAIISVVYFWFLTYTISEIARIMQALRIPQLFIDLFILTYKFIFNLSQIAQNMLIAQKCRLAYSGSRSSLKSFAVLFFAVFKQAMFRTATVDAAICSRAGDGSFRFVGEKQVFRKQQLLIPVFIVLILTGNFIILEFYG